MLAIGVGLLSFWPRLRGGPDPSAMIDLLIGSAGCLALVLRHRWTTALALVLTALSAVDVTIGGAALVATFAVAVRRPLVVVAWAGLLGVAASLVNAALYQGNHVPYLANATINVLADSQRPRRGFGIPSRRLAGRDCTCRGVIRSGAHQMLLDLRAVVGLLRENPDEDTAPPQPVLSALPKLVEESRAAGAQVKLDLDVQDADHVPVMTSRTVYRIVNHRRSGPRDLVVKDGAAQTASTPPSPRF